MLRVEGGINGVGGSRREIQLALSIEHAILDNQRNDGVLNGIGSQGAISEAGGVKAGGKGQSRVNNQVTAGQAHVNVEPGGSQGMIVEPYW